MPRSIGAALRSPTMAIPPVPTIGAEERAIGQILTLGDKIYADVSGRCANWGAA